MSYIIPIVTSVVSAMLVFVLQSQIKENRELKRKQEELEKARAKELEERDKAIAEGVLCLLREMLIQSHSKYTKRGSIPSKALESGLLMYKAYKQLGGNGMIDHMKEEIEELSIEDN